jgi:hypothetical protein
MRSVALRLSIVAVATAGAAAAGLPAAHGVTDRVAAPPKLGNSCLVGTWHDRAGLTSTQWAGNVVTLHSGGGDVDHIAANGLDTDNFAHFKPASGTYRHHRLTERVRGVNTQRLAASGHGKNATIRIIEKGWSTSSSLHLTYRGHTTKGYLNGPGVTHKLHYTCTATTLTYLGSKGKVLGTETRTSRKP